MWALVLVVACAACGRLGFDPLARTSDAGGDSSGLDATDAPPGATKFYTLSGNGSVPGELFEVDLVTGQLTLVGNIPASFGTLTGLAYWDANTMYASGQSFVKITLSPFAVVADTAPAGTFSAIERLGASLLAVDENSGKLVQFAPGATTASVPIMTLGAGASGGDITRTSNGTWYWYTNVTQKVYTLDLASSTATPLTATNPTAPFMTGLVHDDADNLFVIGPRIYRVEKATGQIGVAIDTCKVCPTFYGLSSGDTTRTP